jgi:murein tripeptide amidase MpaA
VDGRDLDLVTVGRPMPGKAPVWIIARQHPGESMAEWFVEGLLERLLDGADPVARRIREKAVLYIVPNMNPDGAIRGNLRTNAAGANLNREWREPSAGAQPRGAAGEAGHGGERGRALSRHPWRRGTALRVLFHGRGGARFFRCAAGAPGPFRRSLPGGQPGFPDRARLSLNGRFKDELLTLASKWVAHRFGCVSMTLEMPFKDNANLPDGLTGWNGERSKRLGAAMLNPILGHLA